MFAKLLLPADEAFFETTLPRLFLKSWALVRPLLVLALEPYRTMDFASLPLAIMLTRFAFIAFMAFVAFMALPAFMAFMADFFIGRAMAR